MRYLVVGSNGQLGSELRICLGNYADYVDIDQLDITDETAVKEYFSNKSYDFVINCAAYNFVDEAEDERELAYKVNAKGARYLAKYGKNIIHVSTDYVFDGMNYKPYIESDVPNPISIYGRTKFDGEKEVLKNAETGIVIRTSWLYSNFGRNFVKTILDLAKKKDELNIVCDQIGTPTYARDLAEVIIKVASGVSRGTLDIYHFSNEGCCSWYDFAAEIVNLVGIACKIIPIETKDYPTQAQRPFYSVLSKEKVKKEFNIEIPHWKKGIKKCLNQF